MKHKINSKKVPKGYLAITWFPWLAYYANEDVLTEENKRHEEIHGKQQAELLILFFYILYGIMYLYLRIRGYSHHQAYRNIPFEKEAYHHDTDPEYLINRKPYSWINFIGKNKPQP